jgi:predicted double-glycine peptidase
LISPWCEITGVGVIAVLGGLAGGVFGRLQRPYWLLGYACSLSLLVMLALSSCDSSLQFVPPFSWITAGRVRFIVLALAIMMGFSTLLVRLPRRWEKAVVCLFMAAFLSRFSMTPFVWPALFKNRLANLTTMVDVNGVCLQTTKYTCGPAAAVTALQKLGLSGSEGEIAVLSHTSPLVGTLPACLSKALEARYADEGLRCQYRRFHSVSDLDESGVTLAVVRDALLSDHCVTVLRVSDETITVADPVTGTHSMPCGQFEAVWRFSGIVLRRDRTIPDEVDCLSL